IDECFAYADALRDRGVDARVVVEAADQEESETGTRGPVEIRVERVTHPVMPEDTPKPAQEGVVEVTSETLGDLVQRFHDHTDAILVHRVQVVEAAQREQGYRIVGADTAVAILTKRVAELEKDNRRLRGTVSVESQRVDQLQRGMTHMKMPNTRSGASRTRKAVNKQSDRRMAEALRVQEMEMEETEMEEMEMEEMKIEEMEMVMGTEENMAITSEDLCLLERVIRLTHWFEKMETVFHISNCPEKYQVKFVHASEQNEIQKIETELWNLTVKGNDLTVYTQRFQELILLCTRMVPNKEDRVERFIGGLPDNIQGNVIATNLARFQDAVRITNQLMDKKLQGYAARSAESKRRMESNSRDNRGQQPPFKRQNISGQNVVRDYTTGNNERRGKLDT
ncbi:putative reverse transcriptase domain-containing protein, partial [Tanacetum coccineum]